MERSSFIEILSKMNVVLDDTQLDQLDRYYETLIEWNKVMNLTGITEYEDVIVKHFADSLAINKAITDLAERDSDVASVLDFKKAMKVIDVGTGAGFPGLPMKIAFADIHVSLLDSLNKRVNFLNEVITQLSLTDIVAVHGRAEDYARDVTYREVFDIAVSRAVANLATLVEYCLPFVRIGGYFIAYKSGEIEEEVKEAKKAVHILGGEVSHVYKFSLPGTDIERSFIFVKKVKKTSGKYPRKSGLPGKEPLK